MTLKIDDTTYEFDLRGRIFDVVAADGTLVLDEMLPMEGGSPVHLILHLDPEMLRVLFARVQANASKKDDVSLDEIKLIFRDFVKHLKPFESTMTPTVRSAFHKFETWVQA